MVISGLIDQTSFIGSVQPKRLILFQYNEDHLPTKIELLKKEGGAPELDEYFIISYENGTPVKAEFFNKKTSTAEYKYDNGINPFAVNGPGVMKNIKTRLSRMIHFNSV